MFSNEAETSMTITTRVRPKPVKNAEIAPAMISAPAPKATTWKYKVSKRASSPSCPANRKIQGARGIMARKIGMQ